MLIFAIFKNTKPEELCVIDFDVKTMEYVLQNKIKTINKKLRSSGYAKFEDDKEIIILIYNEILNKITTNQRIYKYVKHIKNSDKYKQHIRELKLKRVLNEQK